MRVLIEAANGVVLDVAAGRENVLVPQMEAERAEAFHALVGALALLAGIVPPSPAGSAEPARSEPPAGSEQRLDGAGRSNVVHLGGGSATGNSRP